MKPGDLLQNSIGVKLVYIPAGQFVMGGPPHEMDRDPELMFYGDNEPQHPVRLTGDFLIGVTQVTQGQWCSVMGISLRQQRDKMHPSVPPPAEGDSYPMCYVSWPEAVSFCEELSRSEDRIYRLPTEAEWEYACRAGTTTAYCSGSGFAALKKVGWCSEYKTEEGRGNVLKPRQVGSLEPNAWGLYDMHGNVHEWCNDWYGEYPTGGVVTDPTGPLTGTARVARGGSFNGLPSGCRSANRTMCKPEGQQFNIGFRIVLDPLGKD